jgi:hypothetical protein
LSDLVELCRITDPAVLPVVKSALEASGIDFLVQGEEVMGLLPLGTFGGGGKHHFMTAVIRVPAEQEEEARELLASTSGIAEDVLLGELDEGSGNDRR